MPSVKSRAISFVDYDPERKELYVTFKQGTSYTYFGVPLAVYQSLLSASSVGTYFNDHIKDKYGQ